MVGLGLHFRSASCWFFEGNECSFIENTWFSSFLLLPLVWEDFAGWPRGCGLHYTVLVGPQEWICLSDCLLPAGWARAAHPRQGPMSGQMGILVNQMPS